jgi:hypothetical protein
MAQKDTHVTARIESWLEGEVIQPMDDFKTPSRNGVDCSPSSSARSSSCSSPPEGG